MLTAAIAQEDSRKEKTIGLGIRWSGGILPRVAILFLIWRVCFLPVPANAVEAAEKEGKSWPATVKDFALTDLQEHVHSRAEWKDKKAVVLFFLGTECPVSNGYAPEFRRLAKAFAAQGVLCYGVHPDPDVALDAARKHAAEYHLAFPILLDPTQVLARQTGVRVVPEAVLLSSGGQVVYRGRIDDRYAADGKRRDVPRVRDLEMAVTAILAGKAPTVVETKAFGCPLPSPAPPPAATSK
jgi:peroxiredoxin